ncbi:DUF4926 domain-containing protein [Rubrobacter marinus]|uniref:DUF4926 domain-containing protein n=1 Tax=Rubrobacter marinus TaxID=2653852 RepID=A0A6G8PSM5_9ACTN|nr:DUF4926 domain-containing protein [Rubrobacter marinus]QIN77364.1 DUF4926 domain-containing protein [Rubrobacter marinus]
MRRIFGSRPTRFERGDAVRLKTALPANGLERGMVGTISEVRRTKLPSYDVQFLNASGVVGRSVVDETDLMPADGRRFDDNDVVRLRRDVPSEGLATGTVGIVSEVSPGPPVRYIVEFVNASGAVIARSALFDDDLASPDEAPESDAGAPSDGGSGDAPEETGLADDQLDQLIAELRTQGQAMQQQSAQEQAAQEQSAQAGPPSPQAETPARQVEPPVQEPDEPSGVVDDAPPSDGRITKFVRGDAVRLNAAPPSAGFEAGAEGTVTWVILGQPVAYLVEFRNASGGTGPPTKVEEPYLSFAR